MVHKPPVDNPSYRKFCSSEHISFCTQIFFVLKDCTVELDKHKMSKYMPCILSDARQRLKLKKYMYENPQNKHKCPQAAVLSIVFHWTVAAGDCRFKNARKWTHFQLQSHQILNVCDKATSCAAAVKSKCSYSALMCSKPKFRSLWDRFKRLATLFLKDLPRVLNMSGVHMTVCEPWRPTQKHWELQWTSRHFGAR